MWYIKEDFRARDIIVSVGSYFARSWLAMLALGGLGHQTGDMHFYIDFWTVFLAVLVVRMFFGNVSISKFKAAQSRKELDSAK